MNDRVPPGQVLTTKWPVLHYGDVPRVDTATWTFEVSGLVDRPFALSYEELLSLPRKTVACDLHCVTTWSRLDNRFEGVPVQALLERAGLRGEAQYCLVKAEQGFTTNLPLADLNRAENLVGQIILVNRRLPEAPIAQDCLAALSARRRWMAGGLFL